VAEDVRCGCGKPATRLCDSLRPLAPGELRSLRDPPPTCDEPLCEDCATQVGVSFACGESGCDCDSVDLCPAHAPPPQFKVIARG
jgi:hypothetical protein